MLKKECSKSLMLRLRSCLVVKNSPSAFRKIPSFKADHYMLDLEDSVALHKKIEQRNNIKYFLNNELKSQSQYDINIGIRVNELSYGDNYNELLSVIHSNVSIIALPKIEIMDDVQVYHEMVSEIEKLKNIQVGTTKLQIIIETPKSVENIRDILKASDRINQVAFGSGDYSSFIGCDIHKTCSLLFVRSLIINAAKVHGLYCLDGPFLRFNDINGFIKYCEYSKALGFDGTICLHPNQVEIANNIFGADERDIIYHQNLLNQYHENLANCDYDHQTCSLIENNYMIGPPHLRHANRILNDLNRKKDSNELKHEYATIKLRKPQYVPMNINHFYVGYKFNSLMRITINNYWIQYWHSIFYSASNIYNNIIAMKQLNFKDLIVSDCMAMMLTGALSVPKLSENGIHLGFIDCIYIQPIYDGDTVYNITKILHIERTSNNKNGIVYSKHILYNQHNVKVYSLIKITLFALNEFETETNNDFNLYDYIIQQHDHELEQHDNIYNRLIHVQLPIISETSRAQPILNKNEIVLHRLVKVCYSSQVDSLCNFMRLTNSHHMNKYRFSETELVVPGPFSMTATLSVAFEDFGEICCSQIIRCRQINVVNPNDMIASISYILDINDNINNNNNLLQELTIKTYGIKNIDPQQLDGLKIPLQLFTEDKIETYQYRKSNLSPKDIEKICQRSFNVLYRKIATEIVYKIIRHK
eukprot:192447_1